MAKTVRIPLSEPILGHGAPINAIVLREPTYDEYMTCGGEPYSIGKSPEGALFSIEKDEVIWAYAETCVVEPSDKLLLNSAPWQVAREVRMAILGFFRGPDADNEPSPTSPTTSPSS